MASSLPDSKTTQGGATSASLFVLEYGAHRILVAPPSDLWQLQHSIRCHFPEIPAGCRVSYHTNELDVCEGSLIEVSEEMWRAVIPRLKKLTVLAAPETKASSGKGKRAGKEEEDSECIPCDEGSTAALSSPRSFADVQPLARQSFARPGGQMVLAIVSRGGKRFYVSSDPYETIDDLKARIQDCEGIPPEQQILMLAGRRLEDGQMMADYGIMDGTTLHLYIRLRGGKPLSFVAYWLPSFLRHQHIALRFLFRASYEKAAQLDVTPAPELTARILKMFGGLNRCGIQGNWAAAVNAEKNWRTIVGVDDRSLADDSLFRILEWGGMEVLRLIDRSDLHLERTQLPASSHARGTHAEAVLERLRRIQVENANSDTTPSPIAAILIAAEPAAPRPFAGMPASTTEPGVPRLLVLEYGTRQVLVQKSTGYDQLQQSIRRYFPEIPMGHRLSFHTKDLPISNDSSVEVSPDVWPMVIPILERITVHALAAPSPVTPRPDSQTPYTQLFVQIPHLDRETRLVSFEVKPTATVGALKPSIRDAEGIPVDNQRFLFKGNWVEDSQTMQELGVKYGPEWLVRVPDYFVRSPLIRAIRAGLSKRHSQGILIVYEPINGEFESLTK
ncbi:hypothetical protein NMY22_g14607 [Coprinellus aureogranulatus]|nr:hypothetical protein NMY22_g14607 [Coprinellus aureogranulatus]